MKTRYVARSPDVAARLLDDEMIILSVRDSTLFTLNSVATAIWKAADGSTSLREIVEGTVCEEFDVDVGPAWEDAEAFVEELAGCGILLLSNQPITSLAGAESGGLPLEEDA